MYVAMIGAGYVGLTTAACLAKLGHNVRCHDIDRNRIEALQEGELPIFEPGLRETMEEAAAAGRLHFSPAARDAVEDAAAVILAVGTPSLPDGDIDLAQVENAARLVAPHLASGAVVVIKSTVSVGTARHVREVISEVRGALDFSVASNPEFLREGTAVDDFLGPDRVVIGADDKRAAAVLQELYAPLAARGVHIMLTATANAELVKHAANAFLALKIGFINDVADLCERTGADVLEVAEGIGLDSRIGRSFLMPGPGYGGSCFPKDTRAFAATARRYRAPQPLIETLIERNEARKIAIARRIAEAAGKRSARACVLGAAFKKNTDDIRESPAMTIIAELVKAGLAVSSHDPKAAANARRVRQDVVWNDCPYEAARGCDVVVIATEWDEYRALDLARLSKAMSGRLLFDLRSIVEPAAVIAAGLDYRGVGRGDRRASARHTVATGGVGFGRKVAAPEI